MWLWFLNCLGCSLKHQSNFRHKKSTFFHFSICEMLNRKVGNIDKIVNRNVFYFVWVFDCLEEWNLSVWLNLNTIDWQRLLVSHTQPPVDLQRKVWHYGLRGRAGYPLKWGWIPGFFFGNEPLNCSWWLWRQCMNNREMRCTWKLCMNMYDIWALSCFQTSCQDIQHPSDKLQSRHPWHRCLGPLHLSSALSCSTTNNHLGLTM